MLVTFRRVLESAVGDGEEQLRLQEEVAEAGRLDADVRTAEKEERRRRMGAAVGRSAEATWKGRRIDRSTSFDDGHPPPGSHDAIGMGMDYVRGGSSTRFVCCRW